MAALAYEIARRPAALRIAFTVIRALGIRGWQRGYGGKAVPKAAVQPLER
ncbi:MAG: hypothetical protein LBF83_09600 [Spirochaetaceae bacterium]|nr:hypothetical protein [Spirochaetaceae bacterium]